ncbi:SsrA-binding protein [Winogradskyella undariae]|uniref:SsrA-binding protein n=1 Tax=Winogradskyella TaxID=286104 RepID=UPI00156A8E62|nr:MULTISPECIES: SsrA-binding protein [Winogradskyella]NRR92764.1 SsrA-binding protein [Winogradskyella undariae]QXP79803.1 SsrA-binding protein [Winogradskyella sp. HaHa_3_26]
MKTFIFKLIAKVNKAILPSYSKQQLDLSKATKIQLAIIGWRVYITKNAIG